MKPKTRCELCKCLNLIEDGKKHPSRTVWLALTRKFENIRLRDRKTIETFCDNHRTPLNLVADIRSVDAFIREVFSAVEKALAKGTSV